MWVLWVRIAVLGSPGSEDSRNSDFRNLDLGYVGLRFLLYPAFIVPTFVVEGIQSLRVGSLSLLIMV